VCPKCKSPYWNEPVRDLLGYQHFVNAIAETLREANRPMTWTEIREEAGLQQKFPNNRWVRKMEEDIGLIREKTKAGKTMWRLREERTA